MSDDELAVVCARGASSSGRFTDDITGICADCGTVIHWRPHTPEPSTKVCMECFFASKDADRLTDIEVTYETIKDLVELARKGKL